MARNALEVSIAAAERANKQLAKITARLGTKAHPRGRILAAYNKARRELKQVLDNPVNGNVRRAEVSRILQTLESEVQAATLEALQSGAGVGNMLATTELDAYGIPVPLEAIPFELVGLETASIMDAFNAQRGSVLALIAAGVLSNLIVGDRQRQGVLRPAPIIRRVSDASTLVANTTSEQMRQDSDLDTRFQRQAIAAIDGRTTETCLRVHGQIVGLDEPFRLTGTPRFADTMLKPPFHNFCRTVDVIYQAELDTTGITQNLRSLARDELGRRLEQK